MKAMVRTTYGGPEVLHVEERPAPVPGPRQLLVRVRATTVNYGDLLGRDFGHTPPERFNMPLPLYWMARLAFGLRRPRNLILGSEFSGTVEAVGDRVTSLRPGDDVFGYTGQNQGAYAELLCLDEREPVLPKPTSLSHEEAASLPYGAIMAWPFVRDHVRPGMRVLVHGASGAIGRAAVMLARHVGAEVDATCSAASAESVRALGARRVFDRTREDFTTSGERWDRIIDVLGKARFEDTRRVLAPGGVHLCASFKGRKLWQALRTRRADPRLVCSLSPGGRADLVEVARLLEAGALRPVIDRIFPLAEAAQAHRHAESAARRGAVVLTVPPASTW